MARFPLKLSSRQTGAFRISKEQFDALGRAVLSKVEGICPDRGSRLATDLAYLAYYRLVERKTPGSGRSFYVVTEYGRAVMLEFGDPA